jgi:hypothetical protein
VIVTKLQIQTADGVAFTGNCWGDYDDPVVRVVVRGDITISGYERVQVPILIPGDSSSQGTLLEIEGITELPLISTQQTLMFYGTHHLTIDRVVAELPYSVQTIEIVSILGRATVKTLNLSREYGYVYMDRYGYVTTSGLTISESIILTNAMRLIPVGGLGEIVVELHSYHTEATPGIWFPGSTMREFQPSKVEFIFHYGDHDAWPYDTALRDVDDWFVDWRDFLRRVSLVNQTYHDSDQSGRMFRYTMYKIPDIDGIRVGKRVEITGQYTHFRHGANVTGVMCAIALVMSVVYVWLVRTTNAEIEEKKRVEYFQSKNAK